LSALRQRRARRPATPAGPIVLDSSCWLEWFADTDRAELFAAAIEATDQLVVPVLTVYEVVQKLAREAGDETASAALSLMQRGQVVAIDLSLALDAAVVGLPLADSLIYATARRHGATLWTQDAHFDGLPGVSYFAKPATP
jgi:predicted nucleic acid-binding protein